MLRICLLLSCLTGFAIAAESAAQTINTRIAQFEQGLERAFGPVQRNLENWRDRQGRDARRTLQDLLKKAAPDDQVFLAYHLLAAEPNYRPARDVFTKVGITPPFTETGIPTEGWSTPTCTNQALVVQVAEMTYPAFGAVAEAIGLRNSAAASYWKKLGKDLAELKSDLIEVAVKNQAEKAADTVYPLLAYYHPEAKEVALYYKATNQAIPRQRVWFNPVDRWLLDNELAGIDVLVGADGKPLSGGPSGVGVPGAPVIFPEFLRGARIEMVGTFGGSQVVLSLNNGPGKGASVTIDHKKAVLRDLGVRDGAVEIPLDVDLSQVALPLQFEVRGRTALLRLGGITVGTLLLTKPVALRQSECSGSVTAHVYRVRYLADLPEIALLGGDPASKPTAPATPATPAKPEIPAWQAERTALLAKPVTVAFSDISVDEVAAMLGLITGATFTLDPSAEPLKDLPVTMTAQDLALGNVLEWLQRLTDVTATPTAEGFSLEWKR